MHIFFDLDGTLTNPKTGIVACIRHALAVLDVPIPPKADFEKWIGPPLQDSFLKLLQCPDLATQAVILYRERFATLGLFENQVYEGIPEILVSLSTGSDVLWVTTSKPQIFAQKIIQHFQLAPFFAGVYGSELDGTRAHKADLLAYVIQETGVASEAVIMVGDRRHDVLGAKQNSIPAIGVTWGFGSATELQDAGASILCHAPWGLPQAIETIRERDWIRR
ncbi:MAG: HAD family hydrolase [Leptolyngbya sp. SIO1D8]|nr:HAD family hydrolase [Leptolyngbya sp. SIO1D8]